MCGSSMLSCSLLLAAYECGNTSTAAVYDVSLTTIDIRVAWGMTAPLREKGILDMIGSR